MGELPVTIIRLVTGLMRMCASYYLCSMICLATYTPLADACERE